jgi:hypothetical protein
MHGMEVGTGESLGEDCLNAVFAKGTYQCMTDRNFAKEINSCDLLDRSLTAENCEAPALFPKFAQFGVCDSTAGPSKFFFLTVHDTPSSSRVAAVMPQGYICLHWSSPCPGRTTKSAPGLSFGGLGEGGA